MNSYQLTTIEHLINIELQKQPRTYEEFYTSIISDLEIEVYRIKQDLSKIICTLEDHERMAIYIQLHQQKLLLLMESVAVYLPDYEVIDINAFTIIEEWLGYKTIYNCLEGLLTLMENSFSTYMSIEFVAPIYYQFSASQFVRGQLEYINYGIDAAQIKHELSNILFEPIYKFLVIQIGNNDQFTYRQISYIKRYSEELATLLLSYGEEDIMLKLQDLLICLNYNNIDYYNYVTKSITKELDELPHTKQKLVKLNWIQKRIKSLPVKPGIHFVNRETSLKELLLVWIAEEINYLEYISKFTDYSAIPHDLAKWKDFKIILNASVQQISYTVNMAMEMDLISNENKTEISNFIAFFCTSIKKDDLSKNSVRRKLYKPGAGVAQSVRDGMLKFINLSREK